MTIAVENNVLRLQVSVHDVDAVQVLDGQQDLCQVEGGNPLRHPVSLVQKIEKASAGIVLSHEEDLLLCLECADEFYLELKNEHMNFIGRGLQQLITPK